MDFGDILDKWEQGKTRVDGKKKPKPQAADSAADVAPDRVNPLDAWLRVNGVYDKDADAETGRQNAAENRRRLRSKKPDAFLDIHGLTRDEAWEALERFFSASQSRGFEKVLIIHGKGNHSRGEAVLGRTVHDFIERCPIAGENGHEKAVSGGSGATWVLLKQVSVRGQA
jgi:DNA-nicking Smr family endonuclease